MVFTRTCLRGHVLPSGLPAPGEDDACPECGAPFRTEEEDAAGSDAPPETTRDPRRSLWSVMHAPASEAQPAGKSATGANGNDGAQAERDGNAAPDFAQSPAATGAAVAAESPPSIPADAGTDSAAPEADKRRSLWDVISRNPAPKGLPTEAPRRPQIGWEEVGTGDESETPPDAQPARDSEKTPAAEAPPESRPTDKPRFEWQERGRKDAPAPIAWTQSGAVDERATKSKSERPPSDGGVDPGPRPTFAPPRRDEQSDAPPSEDAAPAWLRGGARHSAGITFEATDATPEAPAETGPEPVAPPAARYVSDDEIDPEMLAGFLDEPEGPAGIAFEEVGTPGAEAAPEGMPAAGARWVPDAPAAGVFTGFVPDDEIDGSFVPDDDEDEAAAHAPAGTGGVLFQEVAPHEAPRYYEPGTEEESAEDEAEPATAAPARPPRPSEPVVPTWSRAAFVGAGLGIAAIPLAGLAALPHVAWRVPALVVGMFGMSIGYLAVNECRRAKGRRRGGTIAWSGVVCGLVGMFLGPLVMTRYGDAYRLARARAESTARLERIGTALGDFYARDDRYPAGCTVEFTGDGNRLPLHGWMTQILPYVDEVDLFRSIDMQQPFDADVNLRAMQTTVPAFQTPDGSLERVGRGYAVAHFAGVGGSKPVGAKNVQFGLFDTGSRVTQADVKDGLTTTLAVGEVGSNIPPWGDPHNWRQPGRGINRENNGFGNADRTGALFLFADGSVRFLSNKTNPQVLEHLATRNGAEEIQGGIP